MKPFLCLFIPLFLLSAGRANAQSEYEKTDARAATFTESYSDAADLGKKLAAPFSTDKEKARVLFSWIARNMRYDCPKYQHPDNPRFSGATKEAIQQAQAKWEADQLRQTLKRKKGVCEDYCRLFKAMCDGAGLEALVITGTARSFFKPFRKLPNKPNHSWNAVKIDGQWRLLDATWAAGYVDEGVTKFTAEYQPGYFLTPPKWFALEHFPQENNWQLLDTLVTREAFPDQPLVHFGQHDYPIEDFFPTTAKPVVVNGKMEIRIRFTMVPPALLVVSRDTKPIPFDQTEEDGVTVLQFDPPGRGDITVFGGEKKGRKEWLLRYNY